MILKNQIEVKEIDLIPKDPSNPSVKVVNKIFSKVSRIYGKSESDNIEVVLDINSDLLFIKEGDIIDFLIDDSPFEMKKPENNDKRVFDIEKLTDMENIRDYEYVMHGVIFHSGTEGNKIFFYASFGGLLLKYFGLVKSIHLKDIQLDKRILLLIRKINKKNKKGGYLLDINN